MVFKQIARSIYGKGSDAFNNIIEYEGKLCYIPTGNACFKKRLEYIYKANFSREYNEIIQDSERCKKNNDLSESSTIL